MIDNEKLNLEIDREWQKCNPVDEGMGVETANIHIEQFDHIARYFYELGCRRTAEKYDETETLEKEMEAFLGDWRSDTLPEIQDDMLNFARHFAQWGAEHAIDSSEKSMKQDELEKEIENAWENLEKDYSPAALDKTTILVSGLVGEKQFSKIARHFAQWGAEHLADDRKMTRDVEDVAAEKAREYALSLPGGERTTAVGSTYSESGYYHGFVDGSKFKSDEKSFVENLDEAAEEWAKENYGVNYMEFDFTQDAAFRAMYHFRSGAKWDRQQMLKNAVNATVHLEPGANPIVTIGVGRFGLKVGDKVKVIVVKDL